MVKELLERADKLGSTPGDAGFCFFVQFFSLFSLFFFLNTVFVFGLSFFILNADPAGHALGSIYILRLSPEFYFGKGRSQKLLICILAKLTTRKTISCQDMSLLCNS